MTRIKICGNRTPADLAATSGADAQGFIVDVPSSSRSLDPECARALMDCVAPFTSAVLITTTTDPHRIAELVEATEPNAVQIHADTSPQDLGCIRASLPVGVRLIGVLPLTDDTGPHVVQRAVSLAEAPIDALLVDTQINGRSGGTGVPHDWTLSRRIRDAIAPCPLILAGGLDPDNVREAIEVVRPYAVDVSSGAEANGRKDPDRVAALLEEVRGGPRPRHVATV